MSEFRNPTPQERDYCIELAKCLNVDYLNLEKHKKSYAIQFYKI